MLDSHCLNQEIQWLVLDGSIKKFISEFEKLNHVELSESSGLNELQKLVLDKKSFSDLKDLQGMASSLEGGLASGAMAGALTAFGAYGAAGGLAKVMGCNMRTAQSRVRNALKIMRKEQENER